LPPPLESIRRSACVAAIQCPSPIGKLAQNRERLRDLIVEAVRRGAQIVVLPECAVPGYMDARNDITWDRSFSSGSQSRPVEVAAERVPGASTKYFGELARKLSIYLSVPLIEVDHGSYFNCVVLIGPEGRILARHRKANLWPPGDAGWADPGTGEPQVVATPYGRLGLMICYEVHVMPQRLQGKADIVLYSVGWYGPNTEAWFHDQLPAQYVKPRGFAVIAANWSAESNDDAWQGAGYSTIINRDGTILAMSAKIDGTDIVIGDLPIRNAAETVPAKSDPGDE
jgi:predicted amidohydrolase